IASDQRVIGGKPIAREIRRDRMKQDSHGVFFTATFTSYEFATQFAFAALNNGSPFSISNGPRHLDANKTASEKIDAKNKFADRRICLPMPKMDDRPYGPACAHCIVHSRLWRRMI